MIGRQGHGITETKLQRKTKYVISLRSIIQFKTHCWIQEQIKSSCTQNGWRQAVEHNYKSTWQKVRGRPIRF
jgi:hypothetical protein